MARKLTIAQRKAREERRFHILFAVGITATILLGSLILLELRQPSFTLCHPNPTGAIQCMTVSGIPNFGQ